MNKTKRFPHHWQIVKLGNYLSETGNTSIEPFKYPNEQFESYSVPSYETDKPEIVLGREIQSNKILVLEETVLLSKINPRINRVWIVGNHSNLKKIASTEWICFPKNDDFDPIFLRYLLMENNFRKFLVQNISGVGGSLMRVNPSVIKNYPIPLPPLAEQKQIVAILQEADALRRKKKDILEKSNRLASALFLEMFGELKHFPSVKIKDIASNDHYALSSGPFGSNLTSKHYASEGVIILRGTNITSGKLDLTDVKYVSEDKALELKRSEIKPKDIVIVAVGSSGQALKIPETLPRAIMSQNFNKITPNLEKVNPTYLQYAINSDITQYQFSKETTDTVRTFLSLTNIKEVKIPLPPLPIQNDFAIKVEAIEETTKQIESSLQKMEKLYDSLLQKAFTGDLTESWRVVRQAHHDSNEPSFKGKKLQIQAFEFKQPNIEQDVIKEETPPSLSSSRLWLKKQLSEEQKLVLDKWRKWGEFPITPQTRGFSDLIEEVVYEGQGKNAEEKKEIVIRILNQLVGIGFAEKISVQTSEFGYITGYRYLGENDRSKTKISDLNQLQSKKAE